MQSYESTPEFARQKDREDKLQGFRSRFFFPPSPAPAHDALPSPAHTSHPSPAREAIYFCGNSLGLQPRQAAEFIQQELKDWQELAIGGYLHARNPWMTYAQPLRQPLARMLGCLEEEVTVMNALTVNLHLLLLTFYRPRSSGQVSPASSHAVSPLTQAGPRTSAGPASPRPSSFVPSGYIGRSRGLSPSASARYKILMEAGAFPSDQYAVETQVRWHGYDPKDAVIEVHPREGEKLIREEDILVAIDRHKDELALVLWGGINYYTGQLFDLETITAAAHRAGALAGFDLAHAAGNTPLRLHDWGVDFAVWCSYKYLNAGPGAAGGAYLHERHARDKELIRLGGWWGNDESTRFRMEKGFVPKANAEGWNMSTAQVFNMVSLKASLALFEEAGIERLRAKSMELTAYLLFLLQTLDNIRFQVITPAEPHRRGAQLSLFFEEKGREIHQKMIEAGIIVDYREPGVIRVAPAPLYNSFEDVYRFYHILRQFQ
jgi:kynureninase